MSKAMSYLPYISLGLIIITCIGIVFVCYWGLRRRRIQRALQANSQQTIVVHVRPGRNREDQPVPVYSIPGANIGVLDFDPVPLGGRIRNQFVVLEDDLPPTYEEVVKSHSPTV